MKPVSFLLVDDLEENLLSLEALLRRDGLQLLKARSGDQALEILLQTEVALALVDVQMPGLNGFELAELMRGNERTRRIPIIFVTAGSADSQRRFRGYEAGAVDFIQKPIEPDILRSKAEVFFELYRQRQQIAAQRDALEVQAAMLRESGRRKDEYLVTLTNDIQQHEHDRARKDVLLREINHRIKNLFSVTGALIALSAKGASSADELATDLSGRLQALARAHDLTLPDLSEGGASSSATSVLGLTRAILAPHEYAHASRIHISGDDTALSGDALTLLALLLHELTTNAAKYGALATATGNLAIGFALAGDQLRMEWKETGVQAVSEPPTREGFGTTLENVALRGLGATLSRDWQGGLSIALDVPVGRLTA
ncbi:response regulator [Xanthobacteraceae bacterium A53D]